MPTPPQGAGGNRSRATFAFESIPHASRGLDRTMLRPVTRPTEAQGTIDLPELELALLLHNEAYEIIRTLVHSRGRDDQVRSRSHRPAEPRRDRRHRVRQDSAGDHPAPPLAPPAPRGGGRPAPAPPPRRPLPQGRPRQRRWEASRPS